MLDFLVHSLFLFFVCVFLDVFFFLDVLWVFFFFFRSYQAGCPCVFVVRNFFFNRVLVFLFVLLFLFFFFFSIFVCAVCFFVCLCLFFFLLFSEHPPIYVETPYGAS